MERAAAGSNEPEDAGGQSERAGSQSDCLGLQWFRLAGRCARAPDRGFSAAALWLRLATWCIAAALIGGCANRSPYADPSQPHRGPEGFRNNDGSVIRKPWSDVIGWQYRRWRAGLPKPPTFYGPGGAEAFPVLKPDLAFLRANRSEPTVTFIGHATVLIQMGGVNIIADPQFSERAFMVQWAGPKRKVRLPVTVAELPHIDLVVVSHNHYDHLDLESVRQLQAQPGGPPMFAVPLGLERWFADLGIANVQALDWWQSTKLNSLDVTFVPAHHWSARSPFDRNESLWGGWVLRVPGFSTYFAGDTGYSADFKPIGERLGPFDLALIPVGACEPRDFMQSQHVDIPEAIQISRDVRAKLSVGIHWGTFELADDSLDAPLRELPKDLADAGVPADRFVLLKHGETRRLKAVVQ